MRKGILFLALSTLFVLSNLTAQNLVINGDLESWTGGLPDGWTVAENITQETTTVHGGSSSAGHTSDASTKDFQQVIGGIQEGQEYNISYWYFDNDPNARTRIWAYWTAAGANLPDNATELRPSTYSEDNAAWQQFNVVLNAPATADGFKFEVRVYNQDGNIGGTVYYDDFEFTGDVIVNPEPSNYPTAFTANASGLAIDLTWTDATGSQLPSGYIIYAADNSSLPMPVDGTPVANDPDLSDGSATLNITYGTQSANFASLLGNTTYYFAIYPYTNSGANIDYKTDGTAPSANATTANFTVIESENFDVSWGSWQAISVIGDQVWDRDNTYGINSTACAQMSGYDGGYLDNEDWLVSPALDFDNYQNESLVFYTAMNYTGPALECLISENYSGTGDPNNASWESLLYTPSSGSWVWTESGIVDVSGYDGTVHIAFKYTSNTTSAATWEVDDITLTGEEDITIDPEPSNYPQGFVANAGSTFIDLFWDDATGTQLPDAYIVYASTSSTLPVPVDGTPVANDADLSDGNGALNVLYGQEEVTFSGLDAATTYYFSIYPYTNSGINIDYKNDGTAPTADATTTVDPEPSNYPTLFSASAGSTVVNLSWTDATGSQLPVAYIIYAGTSASLPVPVDGTPVADDLDLSDGSGALNVSYGSGQASFGGLESSVTYYFSIYPYSNSGATIDYKNDGTAPTANASTTYSPIIVDETFDDSWGGWNPVSVIGAQIWDRNNTYGIDNTPCARMSGFSGAAIQNEDWLISPSINMNIYETVIMTFFTAKNYDGDDLQLKVSTDYSGTGNPNLANWSDLDFTPSAGSWEWTESGDVDLSGYNGSSVYVAFLYTCDNVASATWEVDNILIEEIVTLPEPTNYPTAFSAEASGTTVNLSWTDATGTQLPEAYIIMAGTSASLAVPADGTPVADDTDLSDGSGALNVAYGEGMAAFSGLQAATTYYFSIYPYTNGGAIINYKNDGTAPAANATTANVQVVTIEYENFDASWGNWTPLSVVGAQEWNRDNTYGINNSPCASMSGYDGGYVANEDWLISPAINMDNYENEKLTFYNAFNYSGPDLELMVSENYSGSGDPNAATWTSLPYTKSPGTWTWTLSGEINLSGFSGSAVYIAFKYTSSSTAAKTWELDEILITGEEEATIDPEPSNYPTAFDADATSTTIDLSWIDATGSQLPDAYIIFAGTSASLPTPVDGTAVADDLDLSDGAGALNVDFNVGQASFTGLTPQTTYYFAIYSYSNAGIYVDYKTDGTAPTAQATTTYSPVIIEQNFDLSWGGWSPISVAGAQQWSRDNTYGIDGTPCARMSGFSGGAVVNEDWLVSPAINMNNYEVVIMTFFTALNYDGENLELKISTDYSGSGDPNAANWTDLNYNLSPGSWEWTHSGEVDLSAYNGSAVYVAFKYISDATAAATWEVDNILIEQVITNPEPSNYPTAFEAMSSGTSIDLAWTDATGAQLPEAYVIIAGTTSNLAVPVDGTPIADDTDLSDGSGALNISYGQEDATFSSLEASSIYYFAIYPYSNSGSSIDYKNDGTAPAANATTANVQIVTIEYENFDVSWGNWTTVSVTGDQVWDRNNTYGINNTACAQMSGYDGGNFANEDWLISPAMNFDVYENEKLTFYNAYNYSGPDLELMVSEDYSGSGDPNAANWTSMSYTKSPGSWTWTLSGIVDLSDFSGSTVYVGFKFTSTTSGSKTWEIDEIMITGEEESVVVGEPTNYPTQFGAGAAGTSIILSWVDATGDQLPDSYLILAGTDNSLPMPADGTPVANDTDLSDGNGALNIAYGLENATFSGLNQATTYYFAIYPYTNSGVNTDYKNDGTAPATDATTGISPVIEYQNFDNGFDDWFIYSVTGSQEWQVDPGYGFPNPPCARMNGYSGGPVANDDWLISPSMNLGDYEDVIMTFYNAKNYDGPDMEVKISEDYSGSGDPTQATWTDLTYEKSTGFFEWIESGEIDLSQYNGSSVHVAFRYTSTDSQSSTWEVDEILIKSSIVLPEPTNYPTNFSADGNGSSILVTWTDATGSQIPENYVVYGSTDPSLPVPVDGILVTNDTDLSDGYAAVNVAYGEKEVGFGSLPPNTTFYFTIYPYTNIGTDIDYKTDGTPPADNASSGNVTVVAIEYQNFNDSWGDWTPISVIGEQVWDRDNTYGPDFSPCAQMSGYDSGNFENEDWLVSPALDLDAYTNEKISFMNAKNYSGPDLQLMVSENYGGSGDPNQATWTSLPYTMSGGSWSWVNSSDVSLNEFSGSAVYVAFKFTSSSTSSATWELDEITITGEEEYVVQPEPTNYPASFTATGSGNIVKTTWTDATGAQLPDGYVIFASKEDNLPVPQDGLPVQLDTDLSDGQATVIVEYGNGDYTFNTGLENFTTYYFSIYPFTNFGPDINYKNDGTAPTSSAQTTAVQLVTILEEGFDSDWGGWTPLSVIGDEEWDRSNSFGLNGTACAQMSGYNGGNFQNEDWLISPALDLSLYINEKISFYNVKNYSGADLELMISTDYAGEGDPNQANWTQLSYTMSPGGSWDFYYSGDVDLSAYESTSAYVAFLYTSTSSSGATWELDNILITGEIEIGIDENNLANMLNVYPNPADDHIVVEMNIDNYDQIMIFDNTGNAVRTESVEGLKVQIDLSGLKPGLYFIQVRSNGTLPSVVKKVIIQ